MNLIIKNVNIKAFKGIKDIQISECARINAFVGKNNSGKSSILHAIEMASLALKTNDWNNFHFKLEIKDMLTDLGNFEISLTYENSSSISIKSNAPNIVPNIQPHATNDQKFQSVLIVPDSGVNLLTRQHKTPKQVLNQVRAKQFAYINAMDILYAIKFYADRNEEGITPYDYDSIITEIKNYFPDIQDLNAIRTENDISSLEYTEFGKRLDILYSGTGLKHFLDVLIKTTLSNAQILLLDEPEMGLHPDLQRRFMEYLLKLATEKNLQIFIATHSPVLLNYTTDIQCYRIINSKGVREINKVPTEANHLLLSDLGIRPSDIFNYDICLMVEGQSEVIFFEHILRILYKDDFSGVAVTVIQYGGDAAAAISNGALQIRNITAAQKYTFWLRDRDAMPKEEPSTNSTKFKNSLERAGLPIHITLKREIEFYYPLLIHLKAQQGDVTKEEATRSIYNGKQDQKYRTAAETKNICVPQGVYLKKLLEEHLLSKEDLDQEIVDIFEEKLLLWKQEILG
ncbi:AAA family ATPase [Legionella lytica]|uniref:AAA family ATPase n=1 Tax=Legionella lytica TaxID=96232 RepID=A0ABY4Y8L4_9GAMM|nr:ATP-binding protein [Legionella lytica]USQ13968.1 AAA family ATPase [Legionella lytica]